MIILGHSTQMSDVVKLFLFDGEKQHIKLGSKWKLISERLLYYFQFHTHIKVLDKICLTNDLYDKKWSKIIKIQKSKIFYDWIIKTPSTFSFYYISCYTKEWLTIRKSFQSEENSCNFMDLVQNTRGKRVFSVVVLGCKIDVKAPIHAK